MQKAFVQIEPQKYAWPDGGEGAVGARDTAGDAGGEVGAAAGPAPAPPETTKAGTKSRHEAPGAAEDNPREARRHKRTAIMAGCVAPKR